MTDGMPSTYDTRTTTTTTSTRTVFCDKTMLRSKQGILKIVEMVLCLIGLICVACTHNPYSSQSSFYYFIATVGIVVALVLFVLYVTHIRDKIAKLLRLNFVEMVYSVVWCIFFFAGSIAAMVYGGKYYGEDGLMAAGVFGLLLTVAYAIEAFIMYRAWKTGATMSATQTTQQVSVAAH